MVYGQVDSTLLLQSKEAISFRPLMVNLNSVLLPLYLAIILIQEIAGPSKFAIYHICLQWHITPACLTDSSNAHGATSKFLELKSFYRSIQQQFQLLRAIFVITFGRDTHTGTIISVQNPSSTPELLSATNFSIWQLKQSLTVWQLKKLCGMA